MAARSISITLTPQQERALQGCFSTDGSPLADAKIERLVELSLQSWLDLFTGARRYRSLTELYLDWLEQIFTSIVPDRKPTSSYLFQRLSFPLGLAQSLTRALLSKGQSRWRDLARAEIKAGMQDRVKDAAAAVKDGQGQDVKYELSLSKAARVELGLLMEAISEHGDRISPPHVVGTFSDRALVSVTASALVLLFQQLEADAIAGNA